MARPRRSFGDVEGFEVPEMASEVEQISFFVRCDLRYRIVRLGELQVQHLKQRRLADSPDAKLTRSVEKTTGITRKINSNG